MENNYVIAMNPGDPPDAGSVAVALPLKAIGTHFEAAQRSVTDSPTALKV